MAKSRTKEKRETSKDNISFNVVQQTFDPLALRWLIGSKAINGIIGCEGLQGRKTGRQSIYPEIT